MGRLGKARGEGRWKPRVGILAETIPRPSPMHLAKFMILNECSLYHLLPEKQWVKQGEASPLPASGLLPLSIRMERGNCVVFTMI